MHCKLCGYRITYVFYQPGIICPYCRATMARRGDFVSTRWEKSKRIGAKFKPRPRGMRWQEV